MTPIRSITCEVIDLTTVWAKDSGQRNPPIRPVGLPAELRPRRQSSVRDLETPRYCAGNLLATRIRSYSELPASRRLRRFGRSPRPTLRSSASHPPGEDSREAFLVTGRRRLHRQRRPPTTRRAPGAAGSHSDRIWPTSSPTHGTSTGRCTATDRPSNISAYFREVPGNLHSHARASRVDQRMSRISAFCRVSMMRPMVIAISTVPTTGPFPRTWQILDTSIQARANAIRQARAGSRSGGSAKFIHGAPLFESSVSRDRSRQRGGSVHRTGISNHRQEHR